MAGLKTQPIFGHLANGPLRLSRSLASKTKP